MKNTQYTWEYAYIVYKNKKERDSLFNKLEQFILLKSVSVSEDHLIKCFRRSFN